MMILDIEARSLCELVLFFLKPIAVEPGELGLPNSLNVTSFNLRKAWAAFTLWRFGKCSMTYPV